MFSNPEYVYEVYKERSFSKAAKNLFISQPALSVTIKRIENGQVIIIRNGVKYNAAGQIVK